MDFFSLSDIQTSLKNKQISPKELFSFYFDKIKKHQNSLQAFLDLNEQALHQDSFDNLQGPLAGIPIGIKDVICVKGFKTTAGSRMLKSYKSPYTATAVKRLQQAGAIVIGKCNNDEFAMGSTGLNSAFGAVVNPWNKQHVAGGSSSGSACAVSAGLCPASLGTDTGGSVRLPAHYCHLVGIKPSYGLISRYGLISYASSLDQIGSFTSTVQDGALLLDIMSGFDPLDSTTIKTEKTHFQKKLTKNIKGTKICYFDLESLQTHMHPDIIQAQTKTLKILKDHGCKLTKKSWPFLDYAVSVYYLISTSEASSNLSRYDGVRYGHRSQKIAQNLQEFYANNRTEAFGQEVQQRILMGTFCLSTGYYEEYFHKACQIRRLILEAFQDIFLNYDLILSPVSSSTAPKITDNTSTLQTYLQDQFTVFANLIGAPALSVPVGLSQENLPIGMQLMAAPFKEQNILNTAFAIESELQLYKNRAYGF